MEILGIGPLEIVVILVIALLVFGPDKLPEIGAKMGKAVRELRNLSREITQGMDTARQAVTGPVEELSRPFKDASQTVQDVTQVAESLRNPGAALEKALVGQLTTPKTSAPEAENIIAPPPTSDSDPVPAPEPDTVSDLAAEAAAPADPADSPAPEPDTAARAELPAPGADGDPLLASLALPAATTSNWEI